MKLTPLKTNFNGGELSKRLHGRFDLNLHGIGCAELVGWVPLVEGGLDVMPGLIQVAQTGFGACRLIPFEFNVTQGYIVELGVGHARFYTNNALILDGSSVPVEVSMPYYINEIAELTWEQSFDGLYLFHRARQTGQLVRTAADAFDYNLLEFSNGPFEARNKDETILVTATEVTGDIILSASQGGVPYALFDIGDTGSLFQIEADDFGTVPTWEPGLTVSLGDLRTWGDRVYRAIGGTGRTGTLAPTHVKGVEWDGAAVGTDINSNPAGGVQWEFLCDRFGVVRIVSWLDDTQVNAHVIRRLPFTAATSGSYTVDEGYYDSGWGSWSPPAGSVTYNYGTWRWRFGSFSYRRGFPSCGVIWNERLALAKDSTLYVSVAGDLGDFSTYNELGELSNDMAFTRTIKDANGIRALIADEKLLILTAGGMEALGPENAAQGVGPLNARIFPQHNQGAAQVMPVNHDGRFLTIGKSGARIVEASYSAERSRQDPIDLTRYARHIGEPGLIALATQTDPNRLIWACRGDGSLACAVYNPEEQALGWARRTLGGGLLAKSIASITDPSGTFDQIWVAAQLGSNWYVLRMDTFREEADTADPALVDMAVQYSGAPATHFGPVAWFADATVHVNADGIGYVVTCDHSGAFDLPAAASEVTAGFAFTCRATTLPIDTTQSGGVGRMMRVSRLLLDLLRAQGLQVTVQGMGPMPFEELLGDSPTDTAFEPFTGFAIKEDCGTDDREGRITIERTLPLGATILAVQPTVDVKER
jgi:hypothetical protein